jgi:hypothetical protein
MREDHGPYTNSGGQGESHTTPGRPLCEGMHPNLEGQDGAVAVSLALRSASLGRCLGDSQVAPCWIRGEWVQVYNPCRVKTIRIAAYSIMYIPTLLLLHLE